MRKVFLFLLALAASAGTLFAESGTCGKDGNNLTWTLSGGTLTISGTGAMADWKSYPDVPWFSNRSSIKSVVIEDGVTSIGEYVFDRCSKLTSLYVPCGELTRFQQLLNNDKRVKYPPTNISLHLVAENGNVQSSSYTTICDTTVLLTPTPNYGYHFVQWNDGNTDSPRRS